MRRGLIASLAVPLIGGASPAAAEQSKAIELLLDNGYEIIGITDAAQAQIDVIYLKKGKSHVVCKYVPFSQDWSPLGESACVPINYATE